MVELRSVVFSSKRRERTLAAKSEVLEMLEVKEDRWFGRLDDDSPKVKWMRACIPELTTRRHRGNLLCLGSRAKASILHGRHRRFAGGSAFRMSFRGLLALLATQQKKWYHHLQQVQSLIPHNYTPYNIHIYTLVYPANCTPHTHTPVL